METTSRPHTGTIFSLWHIPSSTLMVTSETPGDVVRCIEMVLSDGIVLDELMLNVERCGAVVGDQHIGSKVLIALRAAE